MTILHAIVFYKMIMILWRKKKLSSTLQGSFTGLRNLPEAD